MNQNRKIAPARSKTDEENEQKATARNSKRLEAQEVGIDEYNTLAQRLDTMEKAVGGVMLAFYIGLKYACMLSEPGSSNKVAMKLCAIYLIGSALIDILYSILAFMIIKKTKNIVKNLVV